MISPKGDKNTDAFTLRAQKRNEAELTNDERWQVNKGRVASRGDEKLGLSQEQKREAEKEVTGDKQPSDIHYRTVRKKPLLMIHFLNLRNKKGQQQDNVPAYGISFPPGNYSVSINVVANKVWVDQIHGRTDIDTPDEEDDYDDE